MYSSSFLDCQSDKIHPCNLNSGILSWHCQKSWETCSFLFRIFWLAFCVMCTVYIFIKPRRWKMHLPINFAMFVLAFNNMIVSNQMELNIICMYFLKEWTCLDMWVVLHWAVLKLCKILERWNTCVCMMGSSKVNVILLPQLSLTFVTGQCLCTKRKDRLSNIWLEERPTTTPDFQIWP